MIDLSGGEFFTSPEGLDHLTPEGQVVLQHLERVFQMPTPEDFAQMVTNGQYMCVCVCSSSSLIPILQGLDTKSQTSFLDPGMGLRLETSMHDCVLIC